MDRAPPWEALREPCILQCPNVLDLASISTYIVKYFNVFSLGDGNTIILIVFEKYSNVLSLGDGNTCICECILKYYDVFGVAFENTCINAVFLCIVSVS